MNGEQAQAYAAWLFSYYLSRNVTRLNTLQRAALYAAHVVYADLVTMATESAGKKVEKDGEISQDHQRKLQNDVQHLTDDHIKRIDETLAQKDKEILQV